MYWTLELASKLEDAPWPATKDELIDYAMRSGAPMEVVENLQELEDEGEVYETIEDVWPDYPTKEDSAFCCLIESFWSQRDLILMSNKRFKIPLTVTLRANPADGSVPVSDVKSSATGR